MYNDYKMALIELALDKMDKELTHNETYREKCEKKIVYMEQIKDLLPKKEKKLILRLEEAENSLNMDEMDYLYLQGLKDAGILLKILGLI